LLTQLNGTLAVRSAAVKYYKAEPLGGNNYDIIQYAKPKKSNVTRVSLPLRTDGESVKLWKLLTDTLEDIKNGHGVPRIDPQTLRQTIHQGRQNPKWAGALEWDVPGTPHRILEFTGTTTAGATYKKYGYVINHDYRVIATFP
jgi:hypothetical protein